MRSISTHTQLCAVIGNPIAHSLSPAIHNAAFRALGLDFIYLAFRVEDVKQALSGMRVLENFRGMSITIPHKIDAMKYVDTIETVDREIGAINTVISEKGKLIGLGTDGPGALKALSDAGVHVDDKAVLMLGAGGAARAIAFTLIRHTYLKRLSLLDIDEYLLGDLTKDLRIGSRLEITSTPFTDNALMREMETADIVIHCTPIGMHPNEKSSLIPVGLFRSGQVVFDIVYTPLETRLLADAKSRGLKIVSGVEMFINQAVMQFEHFTGTDAPVDVMRQVVMENLEKP